MWQCWMAFILAVVSMATPAVCQSGDDGGLGSGFDMYTPVMSQAAADQPVKNPEWTTPPPELTSDPQPDSCSVHFTTRAASARRLKAEKEELAYLHAIQDGNKAVMENLEQYVGAELGNQSYEDVIKDNIVGIQEEHRSCRQVVEKAEEDLEKQLEGNVLDSSAGRQRSVTS